MTSFLVHPLVPMVVYALFLTVLRCAYLAFGLHLAAALDYLATFTAALLLVIWIDADARRRKQVPCYDLGTLAFQFFPFSLVWYCWWSRRWHGILLLGLLLALLIAPSLIAVVVWGVLYGGRV